MLYMVKRKATDENMHSNEESIKRLRRIDDVIENSSSQELYSNYNVKTILAHYFKDRALDLDVCIVAYDNDKTQEEQWIKQQKRLIKKLKIDHDKFELKSLQDKLYIIGTKDAENQITSAVIIRCFLQNGGIQISIIPLMNYKYSVQYNGELNEDDIFMEYMNSLPAKSSCGLLIKKEAVVINQFTEILKIKIEGILDNDTNIEEKINSILQEKKGIEDYINIHKEIVAQYPQCEHDSDNEEEEEKLSILETRTGEGENTELTAKNKKKKDAKVSWSSSVIENEIGSYRVRDKEAIKIFAEAVYNWDIELFKEAKDKSVDFHGLVNYFDTEIKFEFWYHFNRNFARKLNILEETDPAKKIILQKGYSDFINQVADGYNLLLDNIPKFLDRLQIMQYLKIMSLPEDRKQHEEADFIKVIANDIRNNAVIADVINFIKAEAMLESNSYPRDFRIVEEKQVGSNYNHHKNLIAFITQKACVSPGKAILRHVILFNKHLLKGFLDSSSNNGASINTLLISESTTILSNLPTCDGHQASGMENGIELSITGINLLKDNKTGAVLIQHHKTQTAKLPVHAQSVQETGSVQMIDHVVISGVSLSDKLRAQVLHYLSTGEAFDSVRSAMENGAIRIVIQPSVVNEKEVGHMLSSI